MEVILGGKVKILTWPKGSLQSRSWPEKPSNNNATGLDVQTH